MARTSTKRTPSSIDDDIRPQPPSKIRKLNEHEIEGKGSSNAVEKIMSGGDTTGNATTFLNPVPTQIAASSTSVEEIIANMPVYRPEVEPTTESRRPRLVSTKDAGEREAALIMNDELFQAMRVLVEGIQISAIAGATIKAKMKVIEEFRTWARAQWAEEGTEISGLQLSPDLEARMAAATSEEQQMQQELNNLTALRSARGAHMSCHLFQTFEDNKLITPESELPVPEPDVEFLRRFAIPDPNEQQPEPDERFGRTTGPRYARTCDPQDERTHLLRDDYSPPPRDERSLGFAWGSRTPPTNLARTPEYISPEEDAVGQYWSQKNQLLEASRNFKQYQMQHDRRTGDVNEDLKHLQNGMRLTRELVDGEDRFKAAKRRAAELKVDISSRSQISGFSAGDEEISTEGFRTKEEYPGIEDWLNDIPDFKALGKWQQASNTQGRNEDTPELDEWNAKLPIGLSDSQSQSGEGRGKEKIEAVNASMEARRVQAEEHWLQFASPVSRKMGFEKAHQRSGIAREEGAKIRANARARKQAVSEDGGFQGGCVSSARL